MKLITNRPEFYNDLCEEIRLFLPRAEIALDAETEGDDSVITAMLSADGEFTAFAEYVCGGAVFSHTHRAPYRGGSEIVEKRYAKRAIKTAVFRALRKAFPDKLIPWGSLTGIRPTRLLRELIETEGYPEAMRLMREEFDVEESKLSLADKICRVQAPILESAGPNEFGVYVGIPFCRTRCLYCSFASQLRTKKTDMAAYLAALHRDIELGSAMAKDKGLAARSFYMGGGTPTILTAGELDALLDKVCSCYDTAGKEFTVEAGRPDTITLEKLNVMKAHGVTRVSVNPQTMCDNTLRLVGRDHTSDDIIRCFGEVRSVGFDSVNMDLIAGLPGETETEMKASLAAAEALEPDCLTVHTLAIKRASRLHERMDEYALPSVETVETMVEMGRETAEKMGMLPYYMYRQKYMAGNLENVGYSKPDSICIYNIDMMEDALSIMAHGAGAMTKCVIDGGRRIERVPNPKDIATYIEKIESTNRAREELFGQK
ncbi:MAG: coproporphyrinogen dehydrogenase HemZ [Clostridiales bacterium]|nr:coproporphyrinogen dehydrogenase HemZ [Clostridiales bacterium]